MSVDEDYWLIPTLNFDYRIDEYVTAQERLSGVLATHKGIKCPGLTQAWACAVCNDEYGDNQYGRNLKMVLRRIEQEEYRENKIAELDMIKYMEIKTDRRTTIEEESESL